MSLQNSRQISDVKVLLKMGSDGAGIVDIELTSSQGNVDTYTITLSNGNKYTFNVTNGKDGNGIASIAKTGTEGLVDTYTITMDDESTYNFTVTNGRDGGMSTMFYITSDAGSTVTVTTPSGTVITATQVAGSTTEWEAETVEYGVHTITSVNGGSTQSTTVDVTEAKIYTVHLEHFIATITVNYPSGATCTCTGAGETLTATSNPYTFTVHSADTYTITATDGVDTASQNVVISSDGQSESVTLTLIVTISVDLYSAVNDTVTYTGIDNTVHTVVTDSTGHASTQITIKSNGSTLTFNSSVAKNPNALSSNYSKSIALTAETTSVYVMPDKALYWYGNKVNIESCTTTNGWAQYTSNTPWLSPTYNTRSITLNSGTEGASYACGVGAKNSVIGKTVKSIAGVSKTAGGFAGNLRGRTQKNATTNNVPSISISSVTTLSLFQTSTSDDVNTFPNILSYNGAVMTIHALWIE